MDDPRISIDLSILNGYAATLANTVTFEYGSGILRHRTILLAAEIIWLCDATDGEDGFTRLPYAPVFGNLLVSDSITPLELKANDLYALVEADVRVGQHRVLWQVDESGRQLIAKALSRFNLYKEKWIHKLRDAHGSTGFAARTQLSMRDYTDLNERFLAAELPKSCLGALMPQH